MAGSGEAMSAQLLDPGTIRSIAARIGLRPTKQRGQNFVTDANTVRRIVTRAQVIPEDHVLEIGPGLGSLTLGLLATGAKISVIEIDTLLAQTLPTTVRDLQPENSDRLTVICADALDVTELPAAPTAVVANLPYNVAVPVILHLLENFPQWDRGLVMVQLEVAQRLVAPPGSKVYGVPSAKMAWYARAQHAGTVSPSVFWPVPNVDSGLVSIERTAPPAVANRADVFTVIDLAFAHRRKMLRAALSGLCGGSQAASEVIDAAGIDPTVRGEMLDVVQFSQIAAICRERGYLAGEGEDR